MPHTNLKRSTDGEHIARGTGARLAMRRRRWIRLADEPLNSASKPTLFQYRYRMFGEVTQTVGTLASDFQYAGYYYHAPSGLNLTTYRAYNSTLGRWINRDPLYDLGFKSRVQSGEPDSPNAPLAVDSSGMSKGKISSGRVDVGANLYAYVQNDPTDSTDPSGLRRLKWFERFGGWLRCADYDCCPPPGVTVPYWCMRIWSWGANPQDQTKGMWFENIEFDGEGIYSYRKYPKDNGPGCQWLRQG